jgi:hypothetical protein
VSLRRRRGQQSWNQPRGKRFESFVAYRCAMSFTIKVGYDPAIHAYFVKASDVPGLSVASDRADDFIEVVRAAVPAILGDRGAGAKLEFEFDTEAAREAKLLH